MENLNINEQLKSCVTTTTANVTLIDKETRVQLYSKTMQDVGIDFKEDNAKIEGGIGNGVIYSWGRGRAITVSLTDAVQRFDWASAKLGQDIQEGKVLVFKEAKTYTLDSSNSITLDVAPNDPKAIKIFNVATKEVIDESKMTVEGTKVTFTELKAPAQVYVWGYDVEVEGSTINIDKTKFSKTFEVVISAPVVVIDNGVPSTKFIKQYRFPLGRINGDFKDDLKAKSDGGKFETKIDILDPLNGEETGKIIIFPIESLTDAQKASTGLFAKKE